MRENTWRVTELERRKQESIGRSYREMMGMMTEIMLSWQALK